MTDQQRFPRVLWIIPCFDRRREKPLPVYNRYFVLDWSGLSDGESGEVLAILSDHERNPKHSPEGFDTAVITISRGASRPDWRMLKFRHRFIEETDRSTLSLPASLLDTKFVRLNAEYFEDETATPITHYEMIQHVSGQEHPIIIGEPESVVRLGPCAPRSPETWTFERAQTIAHFLDVVHRIVSSTWYQRPQSITFLTPRETAGNNFDSSSSRLLEASFPSDEPTLAVLPYFRQLHAGDKLLVRAIDVYKQHCGDDRKLWWIEERKQSFTALVDSTTAPFSIGASRRRVIQMFMYGAGLMHATSNHGDDQALLHAISIYGRHKVVTVFNHALADLLRVAVDVYPVLRQDFRYWIGECGLAGPKRAEIDQLFDTAISENEQGSAS